MPRDTEGVKLGSLCAKHMIYHRAKNHPEYNHSALEKGKEGMVPHEWQASLCTQAAPFV